MDKPLLERRKLLKLTQQQIADHVGVEREAVRLWEQGKTAPKRVHRPKLADILGLSEIELEFGEGVGAPGEAAAVSSARAARSPLARPLISWVQAGAFSDVVDLYQPGDGEDFIEATVAASPASFWLRISGDSMEPRFLHGGLILCDPGVAASLGDFCVAKDIEQQKATFKKLGGDPMQPILEPLNSRHPILLVTERIRIIGRVIEYQYRTGERL